MLCDLASFPLLPAWGSSRNLPTVLNITLYTDLTDSSNIISKPSGLDCDRHGGVGCQLPGAPGGHQGDGILRREAEAIRRHAHHGRAAGMMWRHFPAVLLMVHQD